MDAATLTSATFTLVQGPTSISGAVTYVAATQSATFTPSAPLGPNLIYTATLTQAASDSAGLPLAANHTWSFTTTALDLGTARTYSVLGASVSNTGPTTLAGDLAVSPGSAIAGFPPGTSSGAIHAGDAQAAQARADLLVAYNDAAGRASTANVDGDLAGRTLNPGVYRSAAALSLSTTLTLDGQNNPNAVFIFQVEGAVSAAAASSVNLINGARASRVFWQVVGAVTLGAGSSFRGTIIGFAEITVGAGTTVEGRALTLNGAVTLSSNSIVKP